MLRQEPGPNNALGQEKFIFPNQHFVYLHDTPGKTLFGQDSSTFSPDCIRVENPIEFAEVLLNDTINWNQKKINAILKSKKIKTVYINRPITVLLIYWTAFAGDNSGILFRKDIYKLDKGGGWFRRKI